MQNIFNYLYHLLDFLGNHRLLLFCLFFFVLRTLLLSKSLKIILIKYSPKILLVASLVLLAYFILLALGYATSHLFLSHVEPGIVATSYIFQKGGEVYLPLDAAEIFSLHYGPMLYILNGLFIKLIGPSIFASKIGCALAGILSLWLLFLSLRVNLSNYQALLYSGYVALIYLMFGGYGFVVRADTYILFWISLGLFSVMRANKLIATVLSGIALGIITNLKIHAGLYFIPILSLFYSRFGFKRLIIALFISVFITLLPFFIFKNLSFQNYIVHLLVVLRHGVRFSRFLDNLKFTLFYILIPTLSVLFFSLNLDPASVRRIFHKDRLFSLAIFITTIIVAIAGAKEDSGRHFLLPLTIVYSYSLILFAFAEGHGRKAVDECERWWTIRSSESEGGCFGGFLRRNEGYRFFSSTFSLTCAWAVVLTLGLITTKEQVDLLRYSNKNNVQASSIAKDIKQIIKKYPNIEIAMGYGGDYSLTFYRPLLVFADNHYFIDTTALMDIQLAGLTIPKATIDYLRGCKVKLFLIPKGGKPFEIATFYGQHEQLFSDEFKKVFFENYDLKRHTEYYDLWECKKSAL